MTKQELRRLIREKRDAIPAEEKAKSDAAVVERIAASPEFQNASAVLLYAPHASEINLLPLVRIARKLNKPVAFPRCDTEQNTIQFHLLTPEARLMPGAYNIPEPPADAPLCPLDAQTLCILPGLTFDTRGNRLGYGKGYYDRFLASFPGVTVGALYESLLVRSVPCEAHDLPVQVLFGERHRHVCRASALPAVVPEQKKDDAQTEPPPPSATTETATKNEPSASAVSLWKRIPWGPHAPAVLAACTFLLLLLSRILDPILTNRANEYLVVILLQLLIFLIPAIVYGKLRGEAFSKRLRLRPVHHRHFFLTVCLLLVMISGGLLLCILTGGIASLTGNFTLYDTFVARINNSAPLETVYVILAYCLLPAFCEELVFRAILCAEYERFGVPVAISVSALMFAMLHGSFALFPAYLFLGAIPAFAMYTARSFFAAFLLHFLYNLFCLFGQPYLSTFYVTTGNNDIFLFCLITLFLLFSAFAAGEARKAYHRYAVESLDSSYTSPVTLKMYPRALGQALLTPATAVCVILFLIAAGMAIR